LATFTFGREIDIHWNGYDIQGPAGTVFSIPDQLYEEFDADIAPVEPTLVWIDTNEFLTLSNEVSTSTLSASLPIALATSTSGKTISLSSTTALNGYLLAADGSGGTIWTPASTSSLTSVIGVSPISTVISGGTVSVSLDANYQTAGTYVNAVIGTSPASVVTASGTSTVSIDQSAITGATAATNAQVVRFLVKNTTGTTITKGSAVYVSGATGDNALISLASATSETTSSKTLGITAEDIATDAFGYVIEAGYLTNIDTSATTAGAAVWLGNTPGSLVFVNPPSEPSHAVYLGVVVRVQSNNGSILVKVQNGYEIDELHDVSAASPTDLDILQYKGSSSLWTKASISNAGIAASVHTHPYQDAGTYVTAVNGTAPITSSTDTAGIVTVGLSASYQTAGTYVTAVNGSAPIATSTDTAGIVSVSLSASYASDIHTHHTSSITTGDFAATVSGGTGVTVTGGTGNASTPTVSIGQAVATTSDVTFAKITGTGMFSAPNIGRGRVIVNCIANDTTSTAVTGLSIKTSAATAAVGDVSILVTGEANFNSFRTAMASNLTFSGSNVTGFTISVFRTTSGNIGVWWLAIGS
jgi:hypothetical protein